MSKPMTIREILYAISNTRDGDLPLFERELKYYLQRQGITEPGEPHHQPAERKWDLKI